MCDHCGEVADDVRPVRVCLRQQVACRSCRIELGCAYQDDLEDDSGADEFERERQRIQYHGG